MPREFIKIRGPHPKIPRLRIGTHRAGILRIRNYPVLRSPETVDWGGMGDGKTARVFGIGIRVETPEKMGRCFMETGRDIVR